MRIQKVKANPFAAKATRRSESVARKIDSNVGGFEKRVLGGRRFRTNKLPTF